MLYLFDINVLIQILTTYKILLNYNTTFELYGNVTHHYILSKVKYIINILTWLFYFES